MKESKKRSAVRSLIWRIFGVVFLAAVTLYFTGNWITTTWVTFLHHGTFLIVYYLHERGWNRWGQSIGYGWKKILRVITYEIILGQGILGIITYALTNSFQTMTIITTTYIWNKIWMYVVYDYIWDKKVKWGLDGNR